MKYVLLSHDNRPSVYSVPDIVADNLEAYCLEFCNHWLWESPHAAEYRVALPYCTGVSYNEEDFVKYLNKWVFPDQPSTLIKTLRWAESNKDIPKKYRDCKWFNF